MAGATNGVFNFEGGCYAKMIRLSAEAEPEILRHHQALRHRARERRDRSRHPRTRFRRRSLTENTRCAYPLDFIPNASPTGRAAGAEERDHADRRCLRRAAADRRLTPAQAMYHFLSGYTAKVAGTERGVTEPKPTFSTCFGAPFMPRHPSVYGNLLKELIAKRRRPAGWSTPAGPAAPTASASRMPIKATRALLNAALDGSLNNASSAPIRTSASRCRSPCRRRPSCSTRADLGRQGAYDATTCSIQLIITGSPACRNLFDIWLERCKVGRRSAPINRSRSRHRMGSDPALAPQRIGDNLRPARRAPAIVAKVQNDVRRGAQIRLLRRDLVHQCRKFRIEGCVRVAR
jgi:hypothetical protein